MKLYCYSKESCTEREFSALVKNEIKNSHHSRQQVEMTMPADFPERLISWLWGNLGCVAHIPGALREGRNAILNVSILVQKNWLNLYAGTYRLLYLGLVCWRVYTHLHSFHITPRIDFPASMAPPSATCPADLTISDHLDITLDMDTDTLHFLSFLRTEIYVMHNLQSRLPLSSASNPSLLHDFTPCSPSVNRLWVPRRTLHESNVLLRQSFGESKHFAVLMIEYNTQKGSSTTRQCTIAV